MTNPFKRGSAPGRERPDYLRPGTFKPRHAKHGGRQRGTRTKSRPSTRRTSWRRRTASDGMQTAREAYPVIWRGLPHTTPRPSCCAFLVARWSGKSLKVECYRSWDLPCRSTTNRSGPLTRSGATASCGRRSRLHLTPSRLGPGLARTRRWARSCI